MPEAFKNLINARTVALAARHLHRAWPDFDAALHARGVRVARWTRHRKAGQNKPVERRIFPS